PERSSRLTSLRRPGRNLAPRRLPSPLLHPPRHRPSPAPHAPAHPGPYLIRVNGGFAALRRANLPACALTNSASRRYAPVACLDAPVMGPAARIRAVLAPSAMDPTGLHRLTPVVALDASADRPQTGDVPVPVYDDALARVLR